MQDEEEVEKKSGAHFAAAPTTHELCRTCRAYFPLGDGDYECMDGSEPKMHVVSAEDAPKLGMPGPGRIYSCENFRQALFFLVDGYDYKPYAVFKTRQFEQECMECEGIDDGD